MIALVFGAPRQAIRATCLTIASSSLSAYEMAPWYFCVTSSCLALCFVGQSVQPSSGLVDPCANTGRACAGLADVASCQEINGTNLCHLEFRSMTADIASGVRLAVIGSGFRV